MKEYEVYGDLKVPINSKIILIKKMKTAFLVLKLSYH